MLHDYNEFNKFVDKSLPVIKEMIEEESDIKERYSEVYDNIKTKGLQLQTIHNELAINLGTTDEVQIIENLKLSLRILKELEQEVEKIQVDEITELLYAMGINYVYSTIERIIAKTSSQKN
jgi:hypothetical protein